MIYAFWNNKGGTGKTSLAFQTIAMYAETYPKKKVLAIDVCPQANLSELFLGGLSRNGATNLSEVYNKNGRASIGGYFQSRLRSPYVMPGDVHLNDYLCKPTDYNKSIPENIDIIVGDKLLELQTNAIATLSNNNIPGIKSWLAIIDWIADLLKQNQAYDTVFIDTNPSFSIYTQIALSAAERLVLPVMADDSSRRALENVLSLVHGINVPSAYNEYAFTTKLKEANRALPKIHLVAKNRITQYMGPASAYHSVLTTIDNLLKESLVSQPEIFTFHNLLDGIVQVRDFQTTGVVAFAEAIPFTKLRSGKYVIEGNDTIIDKTRIEDCIKPIKDIVHKL